ncbi:Predicted metalloprotease, contains C-terminal PDZ domain [Hymenobacter daecheongensis DSM 21074]|uniref:Predicted metalloprotease, contains C-terminal PDZ domain n=1 Tax=Hymenobacter daecheongensis DSM 21074 TaxID=1121955 RepID=A0A1M6JS62_9BACT|nr:PDZ domain-containing protein [Hymenobacter daecheongensis]SHJ49496.1 Predicted metalloprotease, contains C-terminal PDZ domain [Hymenobacter daecheongensis DSM 21074]
MMHSYFRRLLAVAAVLLLGPLSSVLAASTLRYTLAMPAPQTHYFEVEMALGDFGKPFTDVKMPVWAPGSYLVREFAKNVEGFGAQAGSATLRTEKISKNTWRVYHPKSKNFTVRYRVYAFELSVRTSFIDAAHGYVNGTSVFMYPEGEQKLPSTLLVQPAPGWTQVSTSLKPAAGGAPFSFRAANYDELADSPIEIGNQKILSFEANGTPHTVAMFGTVQYDEARLLRDMKKVCEEAHRVVGQNPLDRYVFIIHNIDRGTGGLEHLFSTTLSVSRTAYSSEAGWKGFLGLVAHEYFHLWNVKRIRPVALGPFNYDQENYTRMLWVSEGGTEYFSNLIMQRAGFLTPDAYLADLSNGIGRVENTPGNKQQSAAESSFDAWIKYYRPNENSGNTGISYYDKGEVIGAVLDLMVINATNGSKSLDDVMRYLYAQYYQKLGRGFTDAEYQDAVAKVAGRRFDEFFRDYVYGTKTLDYATALGYAGLTLSTAPTTTDAVLGANVSTSGGKYTVSSVLRDGSAWQGGLSVGDELLALNGTRLTDDPNKALTGAPAGAKVTLLVSRDGQLKEVSFPLLANAAQRYRIERMASPTEQQQRVLAKWLPVTK